jgi:hypothetical protein
LSGGVREDLGTMKHWVLLPQGRASRAEQNPPLAVKLQGICARRCAKKRRPWLDTRRLSLSQAGTSEERGEDDGRPAAA